MKRICFIAITLLLSFSIKAQMWCTPNAQWHYSRYSITGPSYAKVTYAGTVMVNAVQCEQLNYFYETYDPLNNTTSSYTLDPYYTRTVNNVVFLKIRNSPNFDTLYNYNAVPGNEWLLPASYTYTFLNTCSKRKLTVSDTGHQVIQGVNLKWLKVQVENGFPATDTIFERIGFLKNYFLQYDRCTGNTDYFEGGPLRCYSDNQITNYKTVNYACNYLYTPVSVKENTMDGEMTVFPNPVKDKLTIEFKQDKIRLNKLSVLNSLGQLLFEKNNILPHQQIDLSAFPSGLYFVRFESEGATQQLKLLKE